MVIKLQLFFCRLQHNLDIFSRNKVFSFFLMQHQQQQKKLKSQMPLDWQESITNYCAVKPRTVLGHFPPAAAPVLICAQTRILSAFSSIIVKSSSSSSFALSICKCRCTKKLVAWRPIYAFAHLHTYSHARADFLLCFADFSLFEFCAEQKVSSSSKAAYHLLGLVDVCRNTIINHGGTSSNYFFL